jgi:hypothetical protein
VVSKGRAHFSIGRKGRGTTQWGQRPAVDISVDRYKPPLEKVVVIKVDYLVNRGVPGLGSKSERGPNNDQSRGFRYQQWVAAPLRNSGRSDRITDLG